MATRYLRIALAVFLLASAAASFVGCSGQPIGDQQGGTGATAGGDMRLQGKGATFPKLIYDKWVSEYGKANPNIKIDYQAQGSGAGISAVIDQTADFGASDAPMTEEEIKKAPGEILHIPTVLGAVVITYNLPEVKEPLRLSPETISDIFLGKIKRWNDEQIKADNPNVNLPDKDITVVYRAESSGTSDVFTDFLSKAVPEWKEKIGRSKTLSLPPGVGIGQKGNDGVMGQITQAPNSIGYVELAFAKQNNLPSALIKNKAGSFVEPTLEATTAAATSFAANTREDLRMEITNAEGANAYPISSYTYILIYKDQKNAAKGKALVDFLWWATHDGTQFVRNLHYAPLPPEIVQRVEAKLQSVTSGGQQLRK